MDSLYISTIWRGVRWEDSGIIWKVNLGTYEIVDKFYINRSEMVIPPNSEKAGHRSIRGMCFWSGDFWVGGYNFIAKINPNEFSIVEIYFSDECMDIHNIYSSEEGIVVTSTLNNSIFVFDGTEFNKVVDLTNVFPNNNTKPDTLHLNSLCEGLALLCTYENAHSAIVNIEAGKVLFTDDKFVHAHDLVYIKSGEIITNSSVDQKVLAIDLYGGTFRVLFDYRKYNPGKDSDIAKWGWLRGLYYDGKSDTLFVGTSPASVLIFRDVSNDISLEKDISLSEDVNMAVFDIIAGVA